MPNCISNPSAVRANGQHITPALFISTSMRSNSSVASAVKRTTLARLARSTWCIDNSALGTDDRMRSAASRFIWGSRASMATCAPRAASTRADSSPKPLVVPVIMITCPDRSSPLTTSSAVDSRLNELML